MTARCLIVRCETSTPLCLFSLMISINGNDLQIVLECSICVEGLVVEDGVVEEVGDAFVSATCKDGGEVIFTVRPLWGCGCVRFGTHNYFAPS